MQVRYAFGDDVGAVLWESIGHAEQDDRQWVSVTSLLVQHQGGLPLNFVVCRGSQLLALDMAFAGLLEARVFQQDDTAPWLRRKYGRAEMPALIEDVTKHRVVCVSDREDGETVVVTFADPGLEVLKSGKVCVEVNRVLNAALDWTNTEKVLTEEMLAAINGKPPVPMVVPREDASAFPLPSYGPEDALMVARHRKATVQALHNLESLSLGEAVDAVNGSIRRPVLWLSRRNVDPAQHEVREELRRRAARLDLRTETTADFATIG